MIVALGARERIHPQPLFDAELLCLVHRAHDQRGRHVDHHVRVHELGVREADRSIAGRRRANLFSRHVVAYPRMRIGLRDIVESRPQAGDALEVLGDRLAPVVADRVVVHRVDLDRALDAFGNLVFVVLRLLRADQQIVAARRRCLGQLDAGFARLVGAVAVLRAGDEYQVQLAV